MVKEVLYLAYGGKERQTQVESFNNYINKKEHKVIKRRINCTKCVAYNEGGKDTR